MNEDQLPGTRSVPLSLAEWVDEACDRFEGAWRAGQRPRIEDYLVEAPEPARGMLLRELLGLEIELRSGDREGPTPEEYQRRFPGHAELIEAVFAQASRDGSGRTSDSREGATTPHSPPAPISAGDTGPPPTSGSPLAVPDRISRYKGGGRPMPATAPCPGSDEYRQLLSSDLPSEEVERLTRHLESCAGCAGAVLALGGGATLDDLLARARNHGVAVPTVGNENGPRVGLEGKQVGDYELLFPPIGRGGMGVVHRARKRGTGRVVAVKMIRSGREASPDEVQRFLREAHAMSRLGHPHIVPIEKIDEHDGLPFFVMKFVEGGNLTEHLAEFRGDFRKAARLVAAVARAVQHAHERGVFHRDLKPANILLDGDTPLVSDFGLAKYVAPPQGTTAPGPLTQTGAILGTAEYMAPEQAAGVKDPTPAIDVYGLGAILYELLTGRPPFQGANLLETLQQVRCDEPKRPRALNPAVPRELEAICLTCLEKKPGNRYPSAAALADDLERWAAKGERPTEQGAVNATPVACTRRMWV
jgi:serine/threonine-protein kinase